MGKINLNTNNDNNTNNSKYEWDLSDLFKNEEELEIFAKQTLQEAQEFEDNFKGKLSTLSAKDFMESFILCEKISQSSSKIYTYASLVFSANSNFGSFYAKFQDKCIKIEEKLLFFELEFNELSEKKQEEIIKISGKYDFYLRNLQNQKKYDLSQKEERILLKKSKTSGEGFSRLFDEVFSNKKFIFDKKKLSEEEVLTLLHHCDRSIRKKASISLTNGLKKDSSIFGYIYNMIKEDLKTQCELRGYPNAEFPRHLDNQITQKSVDSLVEKTLENTQLVSRYYKIKAKLLGYEKLYDYDRYAPLEASEEKYEYEVSKKIVLETFNNFDPQMGDIAKKAFDEGWIDVYPKDKKRGGAFSHSATPDTHPYVLLNHTDRRRDLFTLAHELGHAIHQYLSADVGHLLSDTPLTTSETASVFAEMLVFDKIKKDISKKELISLYGGKLEDIFATLFRQIIFTTFEREVHSYDGELSVEKFNELWIENNKRMFNDSIILTKNYAYWWSYIPHFIHTPFYCYAYSYGQLLVMALFGLYKKQPDGFVEKYKKFLSKGGSRSPKELIEIFGLDIESDDFWQIGIDEVKKLLLEFEEIVND